jgi:hypothetical protein
MINNYIKNKLEKKYLLIKFLPNYAIINHNYDPNINNFSFSVNEYGKSNRIIIIIIKNIKKGEELYLYYIEDDLEILLKKIDNSNYRSD